jgi:phosphotransferase system enzyme I (PtsP)
MLPMVTELGEIARAREIIDKEVRHLSRFAHHLPTSLKLGAMLEVPSLLYQLDELMAAVDFVSVGSNDLFQFVMATDRGNTQLSDRFDPLSIPFLRVLKQIADAGETTGTPVTLCGELAGKPISAMALIGIGYRSISMSAAAIGPVKAMLTELPYHALKTFLDDALGKPARGRDMRRDLQAFAEANGVPL